MPRRLLHLEGAALLVAATLLYAHVDAGWGWYAALLLAPDLTMLGYLHSPRLGSALYNLGHTTTLPLLLLAGAALVGYPFWMGLAAIWLAHIGLDRMLGYGLKYPTHFKDTHLQRL